MMPCTGELATAKLSAYPAISVPAKVTLAGLFSNVVTVCGVATGG